MKISVSDNYDVTLAPVDPALLLRWEEEVRQGLDCALVLKHRKGKVIIHVHTSKAWPTWAKAPATDLQEDERVRKKNNKGRYGTNHGLFRQLKNFKTSADCQVSYGQ